MQDLPAFTPWSPDAPRPLMDLLIRLQAKIDSLREYINEVHGLDLKPIQNPRLEAVYLDGRAADLDVAFDDYVLACARAKFHTHLPTLRASLDLAQDARSLAEVLRRVPKRRVPCDVS